MQDPQLTLDADIIREQNELSSDSSLKIDLTSQNTIILGIEGVWGHTSAQLDPAEAREIASVLTQAASHAESCCSDSIETSDGN